MWDKFDQIYCLHYKPHKERIKGLKKELNRVGILKCKNFKFWYTDKEKENNVATVSHKHIDIYEDAISKGYEHILILENDIRFHNDIDVIKQYIDAIPNKYDLILFDYVFGYWEEELERIHTLRKLNKDKQYIEFGIFNNVWSCACYSLSQRMMKHIKANQEDAHFKYGPDWYTTYRTFSIDQDIDKSMKRYVPFMNVAVQKTYDTNLRTLYRSFDNTYERYKQQDTNLEEYNLSY